MDLVGEKTRVPKVQVAVLALLCKRCAFRLVLLAVQLLRYRDPAFGWWFRRGQKYTADTFLGLGVRFTVGKFVFCFRGREVASED